MANANYAAVSVAISDPALKRVLLQHLLDQEQMSLPGDLAGFLGELRQRPMQDFLAITKARTLQLRIYLGGVVPSLRHLQAHNDEAALLNYFVKHGASRKMLQRFFSISMSQSAKLCRAAGSVGVGRAKMPVAADRDRIHAAWHDLQASMAAASVRDRMYVLHQQFASQPFRVLEAVLNEFTPAGKVI